MSIQFDIFDLIIAGSLLFLLIIFWLWRHRAKQPAGWSRQTVQQQWREVESLMNQGSPAAWKLAVLEADKLVDYVLKSVGVPGKDFGERIRAASYRQPAIRQVWPAHQVRNRVAHEPLYQLDAKTARAAVQTFKQTLKTLRAL